MSTDISSSITIVGFVFAVITGARAIHQSWRYIRRTGPDTERLPTIRLVDDARLLWSLSAVFITAAALADQRLPLGAQLVIGIVAITGAALPITVLTRRRNQDHPRTFIDAIADDDTRDRT